MNPKHYSEQEKKQHLRDLIHAIELLMPELEQNGRYEAFLSAYQTAIVTANRLLSAGFQQADLNTLSDLVPRLFWLHKDWIPPLEEIEGRLIEPDWFKRLEPLERKVTVAANQLTHIGCR